MWCPRLWTGRERQSQADGATPPPIHPAQPDVMDQLKKPGELRDASVLTDEEFKAKKTDLLSRL